LTTTGADLLAATARLVDIASPSHDETEIADALVADLEDVPGLTVERVGDNIVARTGLGRDRRVILAGHLDTVVPRGNERALLDGDVCRGVGSADMKGGLAVMVQLARAIVEPAVDVTYLFYVCEEVDQRHSGLIALRDSRPELLRADAAILGEPTSCIVEAGCQGNLRAVLTLGGHRAHTARPWMGTNAIHRLAPALATLDAFPSRRPEIDGCEFREAVQVVSVQGGVANNVVPDSAVIKINHRYAPDRTGAEAFSVLQDALRPLLDPSMGDTLELEANSEGALPGLSHPVLADLARRTGAAPRAKLGWTDVSFFSALGIPATNFGPGDPTLAHTPDEFVERSDLDTAWEILSGLLTAT
jgi:succinyl-diaminopimelate desuccinylase